MCYISPGSFVPRRPACHAMLPRTMNTFEPPAGRQPPPIVPLADSGPRPQFSVMLPTFRPDGKLQRAIESVLMQSAGTDWMEIVVVDDHSPDADVEGLVRAVDRAGRVTILRNDRRLGLAGNWNRAISLSRGRLVHLLHQDDYVLPGFYKQLVKSFEHDRVGMAFCRVRIIDGEDCLLKLTSRQQWLAGVIAHWLPRIAQRQRVQTPSAVVARSTYEALGGYRTDLCHALDWEMWVRIAAHYAVWYEPRPLAAYRRHATNESSRLAAGGQVWPDMARAIEVNAAHLPPAIRRRVVVSSVKWYASSALRTVERQMAAGALDAAETTLLHTADMVRLVPGDGAARSVLRRIARFRSRLDDVRRRAA